MSGEIKIWDGSGAGKTINPGLPRYLSPSIGSPPSIARPPLDGFRSVLYLDQNPFSQVWDESRGLGDQALGEFILHLLIPTRAEVIGGFVTETERALPLWRVGWIDL